MARPTLFTHPKFQRLVYVLGLPRAHVLGHLEMLWRVAYASGDPVVGDEIDVELAAEWTGERGAFVRALADPAIRLLDVIEPGRYAIHDLHEHAPRYVQDRWRKEQARKRAKGGHAADEGRNDGGQAADKRATPTPAHTPSPTPARVQADAPTDPAALWLRWTEAANAAGIKQPLICPPREFQHLTTILDVLSLEEATAALAEFWRSPHFDNKRKIGMFSANAAELAAHARSGATRPFGVKADVVPYTGRVTPTFSEWTCPHTPHCGARGDCHRLSALEAARAEAAP